MFGKFPLKEAAPVILAVTAIGVGASACSDGQPVPERSPITTTTTFPTQGGGGVSEGAPAPDAGSGVQGTSGSGPGENVSGGQSTPNKSINYSDPTNIVSGLACSISNIQNVAAPVGDTQVSMNLNLTDASGTFVAPNSPESVSNPAITYTIDKTFAADVIWKYTNLLSSFAPTESISVEIPLSDSLVGSTLTIYDSQQTATNGVNTPCGALEYMNLGWTIDKSEQLPGSAWESQAPPMPSPEGTTGG